MQPSPQKRPGGYRAGAGPWAARLRRGALAVITLLSLAACGDDPDYTGEQAIAAFRAAGLPADNVRVMTAQDYGVAPKLGQGLILEPTGLCDGCRIRVIAFDSVADVEEIKAYYDDAGMSHTAVQGNVLLEVPAAIDPATARQYERALKTIR